MHSFICHQNTNPNRQSRTDRANSIQD